MERIGQANDHQLDSAPGTLGALLAGERRTLVSEEAWVALVRAIADGDQQALHALYGRMHRMVFTLAVRITRDRDASEEVTVDVFHEVWRRACTYDPAGGSVVGWIMNQARSRAIDRVRFEQRKKREAPRAEPSRMVSATGEPPDLVQGREQGRLLREALSVLTDGERRAIETAFFSELTYAEVAAHLNEPLGTIKTRIRSGLEKLRQRLGEEAREP